MASMEAAWQRLTAAISRLETACRHVEEGRPPVGGASSSRSPTAAEAIADAERRVADIADELAEVKRERDRLADVLSAVEGEKGVIEERADKAAERVDDAIGRLETLLRPGRS